MLCENLNTKYDLDWKNYEVKCDENGRPKAYIKGIDVDSVESIDISLSHCKEYAIANVVVLYK